MRLAGRGLHGADGVPGDLFATVRIAMPKTFTSADNDHYRALAGASDFEPRPGFPKEEVQHAG